MKGFALPRGDFTLDCQKKLEASILISNDHYSDVITETAGFVPLEVRFQKLIENGVRLQLNAKEFDSVDMRRLYLDDEFRVEPDDDLEDIERKVSARAEFLKTLKNQIDVEKNEDLKKDKTPEIKSQESASDSAPSVSE